MRKVFSHSRDKVNSLRQKAVKGRIAIVEIINNLEQNLRQQLSLLRELERLAQLKQDSLVQNNLTRLEAVTAGEEKLLADFAHLEQDRGTWFSAAGKLLGKEPQEITVGELADHYPQLGPLSAELANTVDGLRALNQGNTQLIEQALKITDFTVNLLTRTEQKVYAHPEAREAGSFNKAHLLDRSV